MYKIVLPIALIFLTGCATMNSTYAPTDEEIVAADYGENQLNTKIKL